MHLVPDLCVVNFRKNVHLLRYYSYFLREDQEPDLTQQEPTTCRSTSFSLRLKCTNNNLLSTRTTPRTRSLSTRVFRRVPERVDMTFLRERFSLLSFVLFLSANIAHGFLAAAARDRSRTPAPRGGAGAAPAPKTVGSTPRAKISPSGRALSVSTPLELFSYDATDGEFSLTPAAKDALGKLPDGPIYTVVVHGKIRQGKSTLLSLIVREWFRGTR